MKGKTVFFFAVLLFCVAATFLGFGNSEAAKRRLPLAAAECSSGTLPPGGGQDLLVTGTCTVDASVSAIYQYGNVNIIANGALTFKESANVHAHFWAKSILVENGGSLIAGSTAAPIGALNGTLTIHLYGQDSDLAGIQCQSPVVSGAPCGIPQAVWAQTPPPTSTSCTKITTLPGGVTDCFYPYMPPDNITGETGMFGRKVLAVSYGGTLQLFGKKGATYTPGIQNWDSGTSWVRLRNRKSRPGEDVFYLDRTVDWQPGDRVVVTTTDYLPGHSEEFQILSVDSSVQSPSIKAGRINPATNTLPAACAGASPPATCMTQHAHNGDLYTLDDLPADSMKDVMSNIKIKNGHMDDGTSAAETRAAVALLTRSIRIVSGGNAIPATQAGLTCGYDCFPVPDGFYGGHTMVLAGFQDYQVQGVEFYQLGQGGRKARYPVHFHMARKTPAATSVKDCSVHDSMTRWYTIHGTQGVTLARNVGYLSIGHGYYLEDGTETDNNFYSNIGIFARAAVSNPQNPRKVPGILAGGIDAEYTIRSEPPYNSDFANPAVFWIMNGWNDFQYNMAAGANACGACYWLLPGLISTHSRDEFWESYAGIQTQGNGGAAPLKNFVGNYCTSAQLSFNTVQATDACNGIGELGPITNKHAPPNPANIHPEYYPSMKEQRNPTLCNGLCFNNGGMSIGLPCSTNSDCNTVTIPCAANNTCTNNPNKQCSTDSDCMNTCSPNCGIAPQCATQSPGAPFDNRDLCPVTILDHYTSSFHWPSVNFAAIWMRGKWMLVSNSVLTDSQNGGLGFVTGGDYTLSSAPPGNWQTAMQNVFIGNTQKPEDNPLASNAGPFNPLLSTDKKIKGLTCDNPVSTRGSFCLSKQEGMILPISNFSVAQRLFNIYDGPSYQDTNAYLNITETNLSLPDGNNNKECTPINCPHVTRWPYTAAHGIPIDHDTKDCVLPNAAIGWKQPNGFYYPPAFHSRNLYFRDVDIRHLVTEPLWKPGTFVSDLAQIKNNYCTYDHTLNPAVITPETPTNQTFTGFTAVDRQTVLNDDDGSLTGLVGPATPAAGETISVNLDPFFTAPVRAPECGSFDLSDPNNPQKTTGGTADTSPYQYLTTVVYPDCVLKKNCGGHCSDFGESCAQDSDCPLHNNKGQACLGQCSVHKEEPCTTSAGCPTHSNEAAQTCINPTWGRDCTNPGCYGVPLSRQLTTTLVDNNTAIPMMGMSFFQRSMLTANNGAYYINTTVSQAAQKNSLGGPVEINSLNVFEPGASYYVFFVYANKDTKQEYQFYIGKGITDFKTNTANYITPVRTDIRNQNLMFQEGVAWVGLGTPDYNINTGILTVNTDFSEFASDFAATAQDNCRPKAFCHLVGGTCQSSLATTDPLYNESQQICSTVAGKDVDCPEFHFPGPPPGNDVPGCLGFKITLGTSAQFAADNVNQRPGSNCFPKGLQSPWDVLLTPAGDKIAGDCSNTVIPDSQFCP